jgi:enamine deaminase RidA (YjgF/YER057c/UK114 family)
MARMQRNLALIQPPMLALGATIVMLGSAAAQTPDIRFSNPPTMAKPAGYSHVVEVNGPGRTIYIAGQLGYDRSGKQGADFREQATLVYENLKAAVESVGGKMENIVKLNAFLTDIRAQLPIYREVRDKFVNVAAPPASTTLEVPKLAREGALLEVEAIAVLPAR